MRNLKKFLALVLAMMMTLSLMVTANAASSENVTFGDSESITETFVEDVTVLAGMGVFEGFGDGTFKPTDTVTRAEMAAILYRLVTGDTEGTSDALHATYGSFKDVADDKWYAGYVGYCANAGLILGYGDGTFRPSNKVTGYEALVMLLRAIGYDQPTEFSKSDWRTHAASIATTRGLLDKVNATRYKGTLSQPALREVVAEISFQAARVTRVVYTPAFGYQTADHGDYDFYTSYTPLGRVNFGLTEANGVIVGNQETGEKSTILGRNGEQPYTAISGGNMQAETATWTAYNYPGTSVVAGTDVAVKGAQGASPDNDITVNNSLWLKWNTGIEEFAHEVTFWYDGSSNGQARGSNDYPRTVYAMFDRVEKEQIVFAGDDDLEGANDVGEANQSLGPVADDAGFVVGSSAIFNTAFDRLTASHHTTKHVGTTGTDSPVKLYKLISNDTTVDGDPILNVVIELNVQGSKISGVDNVSPFKYVSVPDFDDATTPPFLAAANIYTATNLDTGFIAQAALVGDSTKKLGDYEIGWQITGTTSTNTLTYGGRRNVGTAEQNAIAAITGGTAAQVSTSYYKLAAVGTKEGVVTSYHNHINDVPGSGWVVLDDGTKLNQSVMYNTVQDDFANNLFTIPQQNDPTNATTFNKANTQQYGSMTYRFYLDAEGNYIGAEPIVGTEYVYGTYIDFESNLGTSTYTYRLVGVDLEGNPVTKDVKKYGTGAFNGTMNTIGGDPASLLNVIGVPYRGDVGSSTGSVTGVQAGLYKGFAVNGVGNMTDDIDNTSGNNLPIPVYDGNATDFPANIVITSTDVAVGAKLASSTGTFANGNLFFTEKTKFVLVSGTGTDTQKIAVYDGISELLGNNRTVTIDMDGTTAIATTPYFTDAQAYALMVDYTMSDFVYAQDNTGTAKQADVIFIPAEAVTGVGSQLYYVGDNSALLTNAYGRDATKFTMYVDGEKGEYWVAGLTGAADDDFPGRDAQTLAAAGGEDMFYNLTDTGLKANDGQPIYAVDVVSNTAAEYVNNRTVVGYIVQQNYLATTMDSQTALIGGIAPIAGNSVLYKVTDAKVVNLNAKNSPGALGNCWPGITDLATLNQASSLNNVTGGGTPVRVSCLVDSDNMTVTTIYVCWDQNA